jgi:precorrin-6Y C5,15-methyltransferase (decarboxylating)
MSPAAELPSTGLTVVGMDGSPLSADAHEALERATLVVGGERQLRAAPVPDAARTIALGPLAPAMDALAAYEGPAVVLASGDPGFFGILRALSERGLESPRVRVMPALSSVAAAFARAGVTWDDALVVSMHGAGDGRELRRAANVCRAHPKVALLTGPNAGAAELARELLGDGGARRAGFGDEAARIGPAAPERTLVVAARLGQPDESVERLTLQQAAARSGAFAPPSSASSASFPSFPQPNVVLCLADRPAAPRKRWLAGWSGATGPWALPEQRYAHRDAQITKAEVRAQALARLAPAPGELVWDLGAGSGAVGIECARFGAAVVAVERDADSCARIAANALAHGVEIAVVRGRAPDVLADLPRPDAVFVGGGGVDVVRAALGFAPRRVVVALAAVERVGEVAALLGGADREVDGVLLQASRLTALPGAAHRFAAQNPVFVLWGEQR